MGVCVRARVFCVCCAISSPISDNLNIFSFEHRIALQYLLLPVVLFKTFASNLEYIWTTTTTTTIGKSGNWTATAHRHSYKWKIPRENKRVTEKNGIQANKRSTILNMVYIRECIQLAIMTFKNWHNNNNNHNNNCITTHNNMHNQQDKKMYT